MLPSSTLPLRDVVLERKSAVSTSVVGRWAQEHAAGPEAETVVRMNYERLFSAPMWAALVILLNEGLARNHGSRTRVGWLNPLLYSLALNGQAKAVRGASVLVLGVAYKRDIDDIRESPALDIIRLLKGQGATVTYSDPHVPKLREDGTEFRSVALTPETVAAADCVMIVTDHSSVDYHMIKRSARLVVDTRNALPKET